ncbi:MAG: G8 domain-containing protein, partial [Kiritimatiellaeota bacterium]|nr:G8 domain-containing protein [Kiritimatiellota bacterium]
MKIVAVVVVACVAFGAFGGTVEWTGNAGDGAWETAGNWEPVGVPQAGDDVVIAGDAVSLAEVTPVLGSLSVGDGATLVFANYDGANPVCLNAGSVFVRSGAVVSHEMNTAVSTNAFGEWVADGRVYIVCDTLTVEEGGAIVADAKGYAAVTALTAIQVPVPVGGGADTGIRLRGYGPGAGLGNGMGGDGRGGGGGYGGRGGCDGNMIWSGETYGSVSWPDQPGSSGGLDLGNYVGGVPTLSTGVSGAGGGLIQIVAQGALVVEGVISANGGNGVGGTEIGAGSGGGIAIQCDTLSGSGAITANGGMFGGSWGGSGGGGRIAVQCADSLGWTGSVRARNGYQPVTNGDQRPSEHGTFFITDNGFLQNPLANHIYFLYGVDALACDALVVYDSTVSFMEPDVALSIAHVFAVTNSALSFVSFANAIPVETISVSACTVELPAAVTLTGEMILDNAVFKVGALAIPAGDFAVPTGSQLWIGTRGNVAPLSFFVDGNLTVYTNAALYVFSGESVTPYGGQVEVAGDVTVAGTLFPYSHPENGASVLLSMGNLTIPAGGAINATAAG